MIHHFLENSARHYPRKTAVISGAQRVGFGSINELADNLSGFLRATGISTGHRVALLMENSVDYIISYYGILKSGAAVAPLNPGLKPAGLEYLLDDLQPSAIIASFKSERLLRAASLDQKALKLVIIKEPKQKWNGSAFTVFTLEESLSGLKKAEGSVVCNSDDTASIIYTSGSTGKPKGVMLSHKNIVSNTLSICTALDLRSDDVQMVVLPFSYVMGKSLLNTHFAAGATIVVNNRFLYPADVLKEMAEENVTAFSGVPSTYAYLLHRSPLLKYRDKLPMLRYCSQAGGHMAMELKKGLRAALPEHTRLVIMYGATEASARLSCLDPGQFQSRSDSIGRAIPGVELKIIDENGGFAASGVSGELVARGPNVMKGYWKDPELTKKLIDSNGYYHTGDLAYMDNEGYFYIVGRKDNILKISGHKVNPLEVEDCLMKSRKLLEAAVIGVPDELSGHRLVALCVPLEQGVSVESLQQHCHSMLPKYQIPSEFVFLKNLPKASSGKIDMQACLSLYHQN